MQCRDRGHGYYVECTSSCGLYSEQCDTDGSQQVLIQERRPREEMGRAAAGHDPGPPVPRPATLCPCRTPELLIAWGPQTQRGRALSTVTSLRPPPAASSLPGQEANGNSHWKVTRRAKGPAPWAFCTPCPEGSGGEAGQARSCRNAYNRDVCPGCGSPAGELGTLGRGSLEGKPSCLRSFPRSSWAPGLPALTCPKTRGSTHSLRKCLHRC